MSTSRHAISLLFSLLSMFLKAQCTDYDIVVDGGTAIGEIHWELVDEFGITVAQGDAPENTGECLPDGCFTMVMYDDGNNGWNGGTWTIYLENTTTVIATGTLTSGDFGTIEVDLGGGCSGCSDQQIVVTAGSVPAEVSWEIYDELGFMVAAGGAPWNAVECLPDGCYTMYLNDDGGDGWNGATFTISDVATSTITSTGTLSNGSFSLVQVIVGAGCGSCSAFQMNVTAGTAPIDVSWELYDPFFALVAAGNAPASVQLCMSPSCYTLYMYDGASNGWNGATYSFVDLGTTATVASGTLANGSFGTSQVSIYGGCSNGTCTDHTMTVTNGTAPTQISWNFMSMGTNYASGSAPASVTMCLDTGCYVMQMYDAASNGWNGATWTLTDDLGATVATGTLGSGGAGATAVPLGITGPCTVPQVITASDCPDAVNVCTNLNFTIDPNGSGALWEIPALGSISNPEFLAGDALNSPWGTDHYGCLMGQEINTTWMIVNISGSGSLEFTLGAFGTQSGFYDWTMFPYTATTCAAIMAGTIAPVRCNWNYASYGGTGIVSSVPGAGVPENFEPPLNVSVGQQYVICFSNWSSVTSVVPLVFGGTATVSCDPLVLPVELLSFTAIPALWTIDLKWVTATEENASHFVVQRSLDLWDWEAIGRVEAAGNTVGERHYRLADEAPIEDDTYYRLVVVDLDGSEKTSAIIQTEWEAPTLHCWPSPNQGSFLVALGAHRDEVQLMVLDPYGREVSFRQRPEGDDEVRIDLTDPAAAVYTVRATQGDWCRTGRVIVERH